MTLTHINEECKTLFISAKVKTALFAPYTGYAKVRNKIYNLTESDTTVEARSLFHCFTTPRQRYTSSPKVLQSLQYSAD